MVRVSATITAWYTDPVAGKSGYQVLPSNGRLENDFLDRLQEELGDAAPPNAGASTEDADARTQDTATPEPTISAPTPGNPTPIVKSGIAPAGSPFNLRKPAGCKPHRVAGHEKAIVDKHTREQEKEASALEEILQNQAHPSNLAAVNKAQTPVLTSSKPRSQGVISSGRGR